MNLGPSTKRNWQTKGTSVIQGIKSNRKTLMKECLSFDLGALVFSLLSTILLLLATCIYIGLSFYHLNGANIYSWINGSTVVVLGIGAIVLFCLLYLFASLLFNAISTSVSTNDKAKTHLSLRDSLKKYFVPLFIILFVCWIPWIIAHYPGSLDQDTIWQVLIWRTQPEWYDHHPWLTTALFGSVFDLGSTLGSQGIALFLYTTTQAILYSALISLSFCYVLRFSVPKAVWISFFVAACMLPAYPSFASQMVKDSFFVLFWIPFMLFFIEGIRTRGECFKSALPLVLFIASIILVILSNKKGIYLTLPAILILLVFVKPNVRFLCTSTLIVPFVVGLVWSNILLPTWNVDKGPSKELYSLPLQQTANYVSQYPDEVTQEEQAIINEVLPYENLASIYTLTSADSVKDTFKNPDNSTIVSYFGTWINMGFKHPDAYLTSLMGTNYNLFTPVVPFQLKENLNQDWVNEQVAFFSQFLSNNITPEEAQTRNAKTAEGLSELHIFEPIRSILYTYEKILNYTPLRFVNSPSFFAFYLPLFMICFALSKKAKETRKQMLSALIPSLLIIVSIILGPLVLSRYCIAGLFTAILIASLPWILKRAKS